MNNYVRHTFYVVWLGTPTYYSILHAYTHMTRGVHPRLLNTVPPVLHSVSDGEDAKSVSVSRASLPPTEAHYSGAVLDAPQETTLLNAGYKAVLHVNRPTWIQRLVILQRVNTSIQVTLHMEWDGDSSFG